LPFQLSLRDGEFLVKLARRAVEQYLRTRSRIPTPEKTSEKLLQPCGVFVTISSIENGEKRLRGCIGYPHPTTPLAQAVVDSAINATTRDPRFHPLSLVELGEVVFEVSVLTPPEKVEVKKAGEYPSKIKVGEDGLIVERGIYKGLLLPQVPIEWEWDEEEFLCQCCTKAGLPLDSWLIEGTKVYKFQAIIFEEEKPGGDVKLKALGGR
jgi:uncharacterized protein (TIGR00296 family)